MQAFEQQQEADKAETEAKKETAKRASTLEKAAEAARRKERAAEQVEREKTNHAAELARAGMGQEAAGGKPLPSPAKRTASPTPPDGPIDRLELFQQASKGPKVTITEGASASLSSKLSNFERNKKNLQAEVQVQKAEAARVATLAKARAMAQRKEEAEAAAEREGLARAAEASRAAAGFVSPALSSQAAPSPGGTRRERALGRVYREFDLDQSGDIGAFMTFYHVIDTNSRRKCEKF